MPRIRTVCVHEPYSDIKREIRISGVFYGAEQTTFSVVSVHTVTHESIYLGRSFRHVPKSLEE